jgi:hypothetical protein
MLRLVWGIASVWRHARPESLNFSGANPVLGSHRRCGPTGGRRSASSVGAKLRLVYGIARPKPEKIFSGAGVVKIKVE